MIRAIYLIKNSLCIFDFKIGPIAIDSTLISGFLDAIHHFGRVLLGEMKSIDFQNLKMIYTSLNESTFIATLIDGDEPREFIEQFLERIKALLSLYDDIFEKEIPDDDLYKLLAPQFTELLLGLPCVYLKKAMVGNKCMIDNKGIGDEYRASYCNSYKVAKCQRFLEFLEKKTEKERLNTVFKLNVEKGYTPDNIINKLKSLNLTLPVTRDLEAILLNLDKDYTVADFKEGLKANFASNITLNELLKIFDELESQEIVVSTQKTK
jgi:hypothetical protein